MLQKVNNNVFKQICCWSAAAWSRARAVETVLSQTKHFGMWQMHNQNMCMQQQYKESENIIQENRYMQSICMVKILCSFDEEIPKGTSWTKCYCRNVNAFRLGKGNSPDEDKLRQGHTLEKKAAYVACHVWNVCHMSTAMLLWHTNTHIHTNPD